MSSFPICSGKYISCPCPYHYDTRGRSNKSSLQSFREGKTTCLEVTLQEEMCLSTWEQMQVRFIMVASAGEVMDDWQRSMNEWKHNSRLCSCFTWWWPCLGLSDLKATTIKWEQLTLTKHRPSTNSELSTPHVIAHRFCATIVWSSNHLYAYFAHVETEVYRTEISCPKSHRIHNQAAWLQSPCFEPWTTVPHRPHWWEVTASSLFYVLDSWIQFPCPSVPRGKVWGTLSQLQQWSFTFTNCLVRWMKTTVKRQ